MVDTAKMRRPTFLGSDPGPTGHVAHDDRGNAIWEWAQDVADEPLARIASLQISEVNGQTKEISLNTGRFVVVTPKGGYNPYESGLQKPASLRKKRDLRELSKWIEERRQRGEPTKL